MGQVVQTTLAGDNPAELRLGFATSASARSALEEDIFGKRILFSDKTPEEASTAQIVADYRSQEAVEADFCQMKDGQFQRPSVLADVPLQRVHDPRARLLCVLALAVARLMVREADRIGGCK